MIPWLVQQQQHNGFDMFIHFKYFDGLPIQPE